jgi:hypothetical protein
LTLTVASRRPAILKGGLEAAYFSRCGVVDLTLIRDQVMRLASGDGYRQRLSLRPSPAATPDHPDLGELAHSFNGLAAA